MLRELKFKPEFGKTVDRFEAWWRGDLLDRPPTMVWVKPTKTPQGPAPRKYDNLRDPWFDIEYRVDSVVAQMACNIYAGDSYPSIWANMGPEITAAPFGVDLEFGDWTTWSKPIVHSPEDWQKFLDAKPDYDNLYWKTMEKMTQYALDTCDDRYIVGITDLHGNYDLLAALRDPQNLCMDLMDCPEIIYKAGLRAADAYIEEFYRLYNQVAAHGHGSTTWCAVYHPRAAHIPSCDFWCMASDELARDLIWPAVHKEIKAIEAGHFHLDGPNALRHLDLLLACPELNSVQWVYGAGNGPTERWMHVYERVLAAGKGIEFGCNSPKHALEMIEHFGPEGLWLHAGGFDTQAEADTFLADVAKVTAKCRKKK